jgi:oxygen-independent coproporphyrinogen-3 oxidase
MNTSLYFHIPFCTSRCGYCDFLTYAGFERLIPAYMSALCIQVEQIGKGQKIHSIYFGGGTPSLVLPPAYENLFSTIRSKFDVNENCEISLEANPGSVDIAKLEGYFQAGFNRISFGMQSARESELKLLERSHNPGDIEKAVSMARLAGFKNINLDLIFGIPGQSLADWQFSLEQALRLEPEHLSLYSLIVEDGTPLARQIALGLVHEPNEDIAAEQYEWTCERLEQAGYHHYEISNWARIDKTNDNRCQHNLQYWRLNPYLGFGAGAVGFLPANNEFDKAALTMTNANTIGKYIRDVNINKRGIGSRFYMKPVSTLFEKETFLFVGFRLLDEGINLEEYEHRFQTNPFQDFGEKLSKLQEAGLIENLTNANLRVTKKGWLLANRVFREFSSVEE